MSESLTISVTSSDFIKMKREVPNNDSKSIIYKNVESKIRPNTSIQLVDIMSCPLQPMKELVVGEDLNAELNTGSLSFYMKKLDKDKDNPNNSQGIYVERLTDLMFSVLLS